jgi:hypothetical protein
MTGISEAECIRPIIAVDASCTESAYNVWNYTNGVSKDKHSIAIEKAQTSNRNQGILIYGDALLVVQWDSRKKGPITCWDGVSQGVVCVCT